MNRISTPIIIDENTFGLFNYLDGTVRPSLYRIGAVMTKRDADGWESGTFSFHSAFEDPASLPDAPDRWSIEVRCMIIYD